MIIRELVTKLKLDGTEFEKNLSKADLAVRKLKVGLAAIVASAAATAAGIFKLADSTAEYGDNVAKMAKDVGIAADAYQELAYAANQADVSREQFDQGLKLFARNVGNQVMGKGDVFSKLGISIRDANGHLRSQKDILYDTADRLKGIHDQSIRAAFGMELFGRSGIRMATFVGDGSEALRAQAVEARRLGVVLSDQALNDAGEFNDGMKRLHATLEGVRNSIGASLLPNLNKLFTAFERWYSQNAALIRQGLGTALDVIAGALGAVWQVSSDVWYVIGNLAKAMGHFKGVLVGLGIAVAALAGILLWPYTLVAGLLLIFDDLVSYFQGKKSVTGLIVSSFNSAFDNISFRIKKWVDDFLAWIKPVTDVIKAVGEFFGSVGHNDGGKAGRGTSAAPQPTARGARGAAAPAPVVARAPPPPGTRGASAAGQASLQRGAAPSRRILDDAPVNLARPGELHPALARALQLRVTIASVARAVGVSPAAPAVFRSPQESVQRGPWSPTAAREKPVVHHTVNVTTGPTTITVPPGTPADQMKAFTETAKKVVTEHFETHIRRALGDHPSYAGN